MDVTADLTAPCPPEQLFGWVDDLARYPDWLDIVPRASAVEAHEGDPGPAWSVDLRGRLGPFARSKRLRMVRTAHEAPHRVRFERMEHDGRRHSPWVLEAEVRAAAPVAGAPDAPDAPNAPDAPDGSCLTMRLHYGGSLVGPLIERLLADEIRQSKPRLLALIEARPPRSD